jgi:hypothetical protein
MTIWPNPPPVERIEPPDHQPLPERLLQLAASFLEPGANPSLRTAGYFLLADAFRVLSLRVPAGEARDMVMMFAVTSAKNAQLANVKAGTFEH